MEELIKLIEEYESSYEEDVYLKLIDKLKVMEELIFVRSKNTRLYFLEDYLGRPCTKLFVAKEDFDLYQKRLMAEGVKVLGMGTKAENRAFLAGDIRRCGIELLELVVKDQEVVIKVDELFEPGPDLKLDNQELLLLANSFIEKARSNKATNKDEAAFLKRFGTSRFLIPVKGKKEENTEDGKAQFEIPIFTNKDGKKAQFVFSDLYEFAAFNQKKEYTTLTVNYHDLQAMAKNVDSLIFNPVSLNMTVNEQVFNRVEKIIRFEQN